MKRINITTRASSKPVNNNTKENNDFVKSLPFDKDGYITEEALDNSLHFCRAKEVVKLIDVIINIPEIEDDMHERDVDPDLYANYVKLGKYIFDVSKMLNEDTAERDYMYNGGEYIEDDEDEGDEEDSLFDYEDSVTLLKVLKEIFGNVSKDTPDTAMIHMNQDQFHIIKDIIDDYDVCEFEDEDDTEYINDCECCDYHRCVVDDSEEEDDTTDELIIANGLKLIFMIKDIISRNDKNGVTLSQTEINAIREITDQFTLGDTKYVIE